MAQPHISSDTSATIIREGHRTGVANMATNGSRPAGDRVPDAWDDDDWAVKQKPPNPTKPTDQGEKRKKSPAPTQAVGNRPIILAKKPAASSTSTSADDLSTHLQNIQIWNAANEGNAFEVVGNSTQQPSKTLYRPELKILKRATTTNSPERDPNKQGSGTPKSDAGSETEGKKETPQEKMERERKEKEERYAKARQRLFGPDSSATTGGDTMEKSTSSNGKNSGTNTPAGGKSLNQQNKNVPSRKTSPNSRQRRRDRVDDDFVPRSAMIAGTVESYQLDQQLQAEAQMRESHTRAHYSQNMPQPQHMGYSAQYATPPPLPGSFGYNNQPVFPPQGQPQPYNNNQGPGFTPRQTSNPQWSNPYPPQQPIQPPSHSFNQYQNQNQHPHPYPPQQQQQPALSQNFQTPYMPPYSQQLGPGNMPNQGPTQQNPGLYDPNYSQKPSHLQFFNQNNQTGPSAQFPVREPRAPDGTGRGGFGFATRGGGTSLGSNMVPHHLPPHSQGLPFPSPSMFPGGNPPTAQGNQGVGFNSPAASAPWGVTNPNVIGSQRPGQIWGNGPTGNNMSGGDQNYSGSQQQQQQQQPQQSMGGHYSNYEAGSYPAIGQSNVWGNTNNNSGMWNNAGGGSGGGGQGQGQGVGRGMQ
ncbi:hypothetical protein Dda_5892 [Drechslerella dactyloides]|uniref:SUZ domain-containing protein n=1 Tax=Drechslerella dactyloides TaxID=74499 RepID=A0AAD6NI37_DREDA|nr:hypothetical protein Dda_5892 [Drechslerella dactyloides]